MGFWSRIKRSISNGIKSVARKIRSYAKKVSKYTTTRTKAKITIAKKVFNALKNLYNKRRKKRQTDTVNKAKDEFKKRRPTKPKEIKDLGKKLRELGKRFKDEDDRDKRTFIQIGNKVLTVLNKTEKDPKKTGPWGINQFIAPPKGATKILLDAIENVDKGTKRLPKSEWTKVEDQLNKDINNANEIIDRGNDQLDQVNQDQDKLDPPSIQDLQEWTNIRHMFDPTYPLWGLDWLKWMRKNNLIPDEEAYEQFVRTHPILSKVLAVFGFALDLTGIRDICIVYAGVDPAKGIKKEPDWSNYLGVALLVIPLPVEKIGKLFKFLSPIRRLPLLRAIFEKGGERAVKKVMQSAGDDVIEGVIKASANSNEFKAYLKLIETTPTTVFEDFIRNPKRWFELDSTKQRMILEVLSKTKVGREMVATLIDMSGKYYSNQFLGLVKTTARKTFWSKVLGFVKKTIPWATIFVAFQLVDWLYFTPRELRELGILPPSWRDNFFFTKDKVEALVDELYTLKRTCNKDLWQVVSSEYNEVMRELDDLMLQLDVQVLNSSGVRKLIDVTKSWFGIEAKVGEEFAEAMKSTLKAMKLQLQTLYSEVLRNCPQLGVVTPTPIEAVEPEVELKGKINVSTDPPGATVYLDGELMIPPKSSSRQTPMTIFDVDLGVHELYLVPFSTKFSPIREIVELTEEKPVAEVNKKFEMYDEDELEAVEDTGYVYIVSDPPGAHVYIDGEYTYRTTPTLLKLEEGKHYLELQLSGYAPRIAQIEVVAGETKKYPFELEEVEKVEEEKVEKGELVEAWEYTITAVDEETGEVIIGAKIIVDGVDTGVYTTGKIYLLPETTYTIRLEKWGYEPVEITVTTDPFPSEV